MSMPPPRPKIPTLQENRRGLEAWITALDMCVYSNCKFIAFYFTPHKIIRCFSTYANKKAPQAMLTELFALQDGLEPTTP